MGREIKMALSATPGLIKRKQIHGAPGGEKKNSVGGQQEGHLGSRGNQK